MRRFIIKANEYLRADTVGFHHTYYLGYREPGNPDYLNILKNNFNNTPQPLLQSAFQRVLRVLQQDLPQIPEELGIDLMTVCVVPRAKAEGVYRENQRLFRKAVQEAVRQNPRFIDGTMYIIRRINTLTTHLRYATNVYNDGPAPYPGITRDTCSISPMVQGQQILLVDDIYTPNVNIDEDAIDALLEYGASSVFFYAVAYTRRYSW